MTACESLTSSAQFLVISESLLQVPPALETPCRPQQLVKGRDGAAARHSLLGNVLNFCGPCLRPSARIEQVFDLV